LTAKPKGSAATLNLAKHAWPAKGTGVVFTARQCLADYSTSKIAEAVLKQANWAIRCTSRPRRSEKSHTQKVHTR